ncbi:MAG: hypothetical protein GY792_12105, partial [Gammaproteobacteria bacterium]|nr:hypothetical protein [Gammaproteobacteria bacterium]
WYYAGSKRFGRYANIPDGSHTLRIKGSNNDGVWNEKGLAITVEVVPPFWRTWWFRISVVALVLGGAVGTLVLRIRTTEAQRRRLEMQVAERTRELKKARDVAQVANRAKSDFLSGMSHELRTPLNGILGYSQILKRSHTMTKSDRKGVAIIQNSGEHLLTLINDLLDLAKIEAGKMELFPDTLHLPTFLENASSIIHSRAEEKDLNFILERHQSLPSGIEADETRLRQVLLNLLGNAIKFTESGQVTLKVSLLDLDPSQADDRSQISLRFEVQDTGVGMQPEELQTIFKPYEQVGEGKKRSKGTGLGLAITRQLVNLMGGDLQADSRPGQGSRFWFEASFPEVAGLKVETEAEQALIIGYE